MNKDEFIRRLKEYEVNTSLVNFDDSCAEEVYGIRREGNTWITFFRERGKERGHKYYWSEQDALNGLFHEIVELWGKPELSPYDYKGSFWISEEPYIRLEVTPNQRYDHSGLHGIITSTEGDQNIRAILYHDQTFIMYQGALHGGYLRGKFQMNEKEMAVSVECNRDKFYKGIYPIITFQLQE